MSADDRREVIRLINEWNSSRIELFALSQPNEQLEFHGVMRFYFQDVGEKVSTKCIRVESTASTDDIIKVLIEKFRPDMKSLSAPKDYAIYETHADGVERKLGPHERPLWIQLDWGKEGREGRFLLKNENTKTVDFEVTGDGISLLRDKKRLSKREKKKLQKQNKDAAKENKANVAEQLYKEVPDSNFTRSISNPEIVMARRRQQKLENKLKQIKNRDGGGTLKVYGETLKPDIPYKTLLMSNNDTAAFAVKETLEKYGLPTEDPENYCLVQVVTPSREERDKHGAQIKEYILEDNACPLAILMQHPNTGGTIIFQIRRCTPDILAARKAKKKLEAQQQEQQQQQQQQHIAKMQTMQSQPNLQGGGAGNYMNNLTNKMNGQMSHVQYQQAQQYQTNGGGHHMNGYAMEMGDANGVSESGGLPGKYPCLVELNQDGFDLQSPRVFQIKSDFYEMGNDKFLAAAHPTNYIRLDSSMPGIEKKHCALKKSNDNLQLLLVPFAETYVNEVLVKEPVQLFNNNTVRLGKFALFRLENPNETSCNLIIANNANSSSIGTTAASTSNLKSALKQPLASVSTNGPNGSAIPANYGTLYDGGQIVEQAPVNGYVTNGPMNLNGQPAPAKMAPSASSNNLNGQAVPIPVAAAGQPQQMTMSTSMNQLNQRPSEGLPGLLEFPDDGEDALLSQICCTNSQTLQWPFKLAPVYTMYMMLRFRLSQKYKNDQLTFNDKLSASSLLIHKMVNYIREAVDVNHLDKHILPYWLANSAELLFFLKQDAHLSQISYDAQELLADCVQTAFKYLVNIMQQQLDLVLPSFFDPSDHVEENVFAAPHETPVSFTHEQLQRPTLRHVVQVLNETMNLLRGSRVNAALTIQLFSQLFHYISMWLFNKLVKDQRASGLCSMYWGTKLTRRLNKIQAWAEKQGLELAADCHLARITQAAIFLQTPKHDIQDLSTISSTCFGLNSLQIRCLLKNYLQAQNEPALSPQLCNNLIAIAQNTADELIKQEGRPLQLEEDIDLQLPFLLPEDGHSCDTIKGLPSGLLDFLENLQNAGLCWLWQNTQGPGSWKKFMNGAGRKDSNPTPVPAQQQAPAVVQNAAPAPVATPTQPNGGFVPEPAQRFNGMPSSVSSGHLGGQSAAGVPMSASNPLVKSPEFAKQPSMSNIEHVPASINGKAPSQPTVIKIRMNKKNNSLGLSIVAAHPINQVHSGIYIKSVVPGGAADDDGQLETGDQLLAVDDASLINVSQERAAELMMKSGPTVTLTVGKEAAFHHGLGGLLSKSPLPQQQQQSMTTSMPMLNGNNGAFQFANGQAYTMTQQQQQQFTAATLPRNHHSHNQVNGGFNQQLNSSDSIPATAARNGGQAMNNTFTVSQNGEQQNGAAAAANYRARSMSQEILRNNTPSMTVVNNSSTNGHVISPIRQANVGSRPPSGGQVTSPFRGLPNEQFGRYGSERPVSMHQASYEQGARNFGASVVNGASSSSSSVQRNLPNESVPRFGSERPASSSSLFGPNRLNNEQGSPVKQLQPAPPKGRQASLSELDEINYNNNNRQLKMQQQQQPIEPAPRQSNNKFDDLYGKVVPNRINSSLNMQQNGQYNGQAEMTTVGQSYAHQYKTLPSRANMNAYQHQQQPQQQQQQPMNMNGQTLDEQQRAKSSGQLYEQIWNVNGSQPAAANNTPPMQHSSQIRATNGNGYQPTSQSQQLYRPQIQTSASVDELSLNKMNLDNGGAGMQQPQLQPRKFDLVDPNCRRSLKSLNAQAHNGHSTIPVSHESQPPVRNYENQFVNNNNGGSNGDGFGMGQRASHFSSSNVVKPAVPSKPFSLNGISTSSSMSSMSRLNGGHEFNGYGGANGHHHHQMNGGHHFGGEEADRQIKTNGANASLSFNKSWEREQWDRQREDDESRLEILRQRIEMLRSLEMKPNRTSEDESRLNKLRTEIEFDKRVLEMNMNNSMNNYLDETNDDNDTDYSPEVRERLAAQMREELMQRRRRFEELTRQQQQITSAASAGGSTPLSMQNGNGGLFERESSLVATPPPSKMDLDEMIKRRKEEEEEERMQEIRREEQRLKRHIENSMNPLKSALGQPQHMNGAESDITSSSSSASASASSSASSSLYNKTARYNGNNDHTASTSNGHHHQHLQSNEFNSSINSNPPVISHKPQKHVQFMNEAETLSPSAYKYSNGRPALESANDSANFNDSLNGSGSHAPPPPPPLANNNVNVTPQKRVMFSDTTKFLEFERQEMTTPNGSSNGNSTNYSTPSVIGANEVYVDQRLKLKQQQQAQLAQQVIEGEKLSFKDKMKLFAKQSGEISAADAENKFKVSRKQREIESRFGAAK